MDILKNSQFLRLWGNQILLQVAFNMSNFTVLLILADRTHSPFVQAQFYTALTLPAILFGLIAGPIVDMTERKRLMLITDALLAVLFFFYIFADVQIFFILLIAFLTSSVARFFIPAEAATIPLVVDKKTLNHANSFFLFTLMGSIILGYALAGPIIQAFGGLGTFGEKVPFVVSSIFLVIGFILRLSLKKIEIKRPDVMGDSLVGKTFILFAQTLFEIKNNVRISLPLGLLVFVELIMGLLSVVLLEYVRRYLELPLTSVTYVLMLPLVAGLLVGVSILGKIENIYGRRKPILLALILSGIFMIILGIAPIYFNTFTIRIIGSLVAFTIGIMMVVVAVFARTILQTSVKEEMHGRIFSFLDVLIALATPIPVLLTGLLADKVSILATLIAFGGIVIGLTYLGSRFILRK